MLLRKPLLRAALAVALSSAGLALVTPPVGAQTSASAGYRPIDRVVAVVNQEAITARELEGRVAILEKQAIENNRRPPAPDLLRRQVLEQMIVMRAQRQYAAGVGIDPSESEIDRAVAEIAQRNNLSVQAFVERIQRDGLTMTALREQLAGEITAMRLREREASGKVTVSEAEIDAHLARTGSAAAQEYEVAQILLRLPTDAPDSEVKRKAAIAEDIIAKARAGGSFADLAREFSEAPDAAQGGSLGWRTADRLPELFVGAIRSLEPGQVAPVIRSPAGLHVLRLVDRRSEAPAAASANQTHARHILLQGGTPSVDADALRRLNEFRNNVLAGSADFAELARQFSIDGSAREGGELGWLFPGETVPEFERAMNALEPGGISTPFRTQFGVHIVQVLGRRADTNSPDRLRATDRQTLRKQKADEAYEQWVCELRDRAYVELRLEQQP